MLFKGTSGLIHAAVNSLMKLEFSLLHFAEERKSLLIFFLLTLQKLLYIQEFNMDQFQRLFQLGLFETGKEYTKSKRVQNRTIRTNSK